MARKSKDKESPGPADERPGVGSVSFLLSQLGFQSSRGFKERLAPLEIEPYHFGVLRHVAFAEGSSQQALGEALRIAPSRMVALIDELEERGLVERRANPSDRRAHALHLTPAGRKLLDKAWKVALEHEKQVSEALEPAEREQLLTLLGRIAAAQGLTTGVHPGLASKETPKGSSEEA
jgi:DNA-binding MarR family transcriptional regulator